MKTPICTFDAKTGILCNLCESKLSSGQITESDVKGSMILTKLAQKIPEIDKITSSNSKEIDDDEPRRHLGSAALVLRSFYGLRFHHLSYDLDQHRIDAGALR